MAKEWMVKCKNFAKCGNNLMYSDRSYVHSLQYGFSRPEYCDDCQEEHKKMKGTLGVGYFHLQPRSSGIHGMGQVYHPVRQHTSTETESHIDRDQFGLTPGKIAEIARRVTEGFRVIIVIGETGSGKSTLLPTWMIDPPEESGVDPEFFTRDGQLLHSQPRILAATGQARYVGEQLLGGTVGKGMDVGYIYSGEHEADWRNAWVSCTDGILINEVKKGKLGQYGYIILDEAHERSENIDRLLNLLKDRLATFPKLKLIIASATIDAERFRDHFGSDVAAIVEFEGKVRKDRNGNPVSYERYFCEPDEALPYEDPSRLGRVIVDIAVSEAMDLLRAMVDGNTPKGDILIFLQGVKPIDRAVEQLRNRIKQDDQLEQVVKVMPLYRSLDQKDKEKVRKHNPEDGNIWVIVATNIAEASITINSLVYEIETGVENQKQFDSDTGETSLPLTIISKANAKQRWGRVGRTRNGFVYCLYTEDQFMTLFPENPTPAIQRSSMEESLVTLKAAGIPDPSVGWLDAPKPYEMERAYQALVDYGSVTPDGSFTRYGHMMQHFSYPSELKELLLAADRMGCVVEMSCILPVIQNGGHRRILLWNHSWDAYTKFAATQKHNALMSGSLDDVEFILKIIKAWTELPWIERKTWNDISDSEKRALSKEWAAINFVDHDLLKEVIKERDKALAMFFDRSKEEARPINLAVIDRLRFLLKRFLSGVTIRQSDQPYRFHRIIEPEKGTMVTCKTIWPFSDLPSGDREWLDTGSTVHQAISIPEDIAPLASRLFVDQLYPIGGRFTAKTDETDETAERLVAASVVSLPETYLEESKTDEANWAAEDVPDEERTEEEKEQESAKAPKLADLPIRRNFFSASIVIESGYLREDKQQVEIVGYDFSVVSPKVLVAMVPDPEPFEVFAASFRESDEVTVEVTDILHHPDDRGATALVVRELQSEMEILVEPNEVSFTTASWAIEAIPRGVELTMTVERIIREARRVHLSLWPVAEQGISQRCTDIKEREIHPTVAAIAAEIRDNSVLFALDWSSPEQGFIAVAQVYENRLPKAPLEFTKGEEVLVTVFRKPGAFAHLAKLPDKARFFLEREAEDILYENGSLICKGRITYDQLYTLKAADNDRIYHKALNELFWRTNKLLVDGFADSGWYRWAKETYQDEIVEVTISNVTTHGLTVVVDDTAGFIPRSFVTKNEKADITKLFDVGNVVEAKVVEIRPDQQQLILRCDFQTPNSLGITQGMNVSGVIVRVKDDTGLFLRLRPGIEAFVPERYVFHGDHTLTELFHEGQEVVGEVLSVDDKRGIAVSLKTSENDPFLKIEQGKEVRGVVKDCNPDYGVFIEVAPGIDGLLHNRSLQRLDQETINEIVPGRQVTVSIYKVNVEKRNVSLDFISL